MAHPIYAVQYFQQVMKFCTDSTRNDHCSSLRLYFGKRVALLMCRPNMLNYVNKLYKDISCYFWEARQVHSTNTIIQYLPSNIKLFSVIFPSFLTNKFRTRSLMINNIDSTIRVGTENDVFPTALTWIFNGAKRKYLIPEMVMSWPARVA